MFDLSLLSEYFLEGCILSAGFVLVSEIWHFLRKERTECLHRCCLFLFGLYLTMTFALTISPVYGWDFPHIHGGINVIPFQVLSTATSNPTNFLGNVAMFLPLGFFMVLLSRNCQSFVKILFCGVGLSVFIEIVQLFGTRGTDIDDVILNTIGALLGWTYGQITLFFIPALRDSVGTKKIENHEFQWKRRDEGELMFLGLLIFCGVMNLGSS